jgi:hypothetical protein
VEVERLSGAPLPAPEIPHRPTEGSIMRLRSIKLLFIASLPFLVPWQAMAQDGDPGEWDVVASTPGENAVKPLFGSALALDSLESYRGGYDLVENDMTITGAAEHNSASYVTTGANSISSGAFAHLNGVSMVIQNSGANVLIQNATIINLKIN